MTLLDWLKLPKEQWKPARALLGDFTPMEYETALEIERQIRALETSLDLQRQEHERLNIEQANVISEKSERVDELEKELADAKKDGFYSYSQALKKLSDKLEAENARLSMVLAEAKEYVEIATRFLKYQKPGKEFYPNKEGAEGCLGRIHDALDRAIVSNSEQ